MTFFDENRQSRPPLALFDQTYWRVKRRDAENGHRDGPRSPAKFQLVAICQDPANGSLGWTNGGSARALACGCQHPRWQHRAGGKEFDEGVEPDSRGRLCSPFQDRDGRAPRQCPSRAANGSLGWTNGARILFYDFNPRRIKFQCLQNCIFVQFRRLPDFNCESVCRNFFDDGEL